MIYTVMEREGKWQLCAHWNTDNPPSLLLFRFTHNTALNQLCTGTSGNHLSSSEKKCLDNCTGRYMETMQAVNQALVQRGNQ